MKNMNKMSRVQKSSKNLIYGFISQFIVLIFNFLVRIVFIKYLGEEYLGVNGLFSNILSVLSLAEMGFGTAMTYHLYKPLAIRDTELIKSLMNFYAKIYKGIGIFVLGIGICILPFLHLIIKNDNSINNISLLYIMFLIDSASSYFFAYRRSVLNADQKAYICSEYRYIFVIIKSIVQIILIIIFNNFILYLMIQIIFTFLENIYISKKVNEIYPYLKDKKVKKLSYDTILSIKKDVGALVLSKIANVALNGTDNIIITAFTGLKNTGILSNYTLISGSLTMVVSQVNSALTGSLGNFIAVENDSRKYDIFKKIDFMYFMIYGFCFICMFILYNPFISIFFGENLIFSTPIVFIFCLNYLIEGLLQSLWTFRTTMGLFTQGKYRPLFTAIINIVISIILADHYGVLGVLLGTTISRVLVNVWFDPYIIFKYGLKINPRKYYIQYLKRLFQLLIITCILLIIKNLFFINNMTILTFIILFLVTIIFSSVLLVVPYINSHEFNYFIGLIKKLVNRILKLIKKS